MNNAGAVLFRRLPYMLSPQLDIYEKLDPLVEGKRVLEIGFGTGFGTLQYVSSASMVDAIEKDSAAVRFAIRCFGHEKISWFDGDITDWDSEGIDYDFIVMIEVLEHIPGCRRALKQVPKLLRPEGQMLISVPNRYRHRRKEEVLNIQEWTPENFKLLLLDYFANVKLVEEDLQSELFNQDTTMTPLIALCS